MYFDNYKEASDFAKNTAIKNRISVSLKREGDGFVVELSDAWLDELIAWADKNNIPNYYFYEPEYDFDEDEGYRNRRECHGFPRDKQAILTLTELNLWGDCPTELPESFGRLTNLTKLYLWGNKLSKLPESIGKLTNLKGLNLIGIQSLPPELSHLRPITNFH